MYIGQQGGKWQKDRVSSVIVELPHLTAHRGETKVDPEHAPEELRSWHGRTFYAVGYGVNAEKGDMTDLQKMGPSSRGVFIMVNKIVLDLQIFTSEWDLHEYMQLWAQREFLGDAVYLWFDEPTVIEVWKLDKLSANMKTMRGWVRSVVQGLGRESPCVQMVFRP